MLVLFGISWALNKGVLMNYGAEPESTRQVEELGHLNRGQREVLAVKSLVVF